MAGDWEMSRMERKGILVRACLVLATLAVLVHPATTPVAAQQTQIPPEEYAALVALYDSTDGANWFAKWTLPTDDPCGLFGVVCTNGHITRLDLSRNGLSGSIPPELSSLALLDMLNLYSNQLSGTIPPELANLANLLWLRLQNNQLSDNIPPELGNMENLLQLRLDSNQLSGNIPPELGNMDKLGRLDLDTNQLSGAIPPELGDLANLEWLSLHTNQLSGNIPPELGNLANLRWLYIHTNQLSGALPYGLMSLRLYRFFFHDTDLCEPPDTRFQDWLSYIYELRRTNVLCPGQYGVVLPLIIKPS